MKAINGYINVDNIDKSRIFEGKKGRYLDIVLIPTPNGKYYEWGIAQSTDKDEETIWIGNAGKIEGTSDGASDGGNKDDLPF